VLVVRPSSRQDDVGEKPVRREHCSQRDRDVPAFQSVTSGDFLTYNADLMCCEDVADDACRELKPVRSQSVRVMG
jgi:hypothetical protein